MSGHLVIHDSYEYDKSVKIDIDDAARILDEMFGEFGYEVLEKYMREYEPNKLFICIRTKNPDAVYLETR